MYPIGYDPNSFVSNPGERYEPEYIGEVDENGFINLVEVGTNDLWALHQRDEFANDVNILYNRFCNGDVMALSQRQGTFLDALGMPRDLRGMFEMMNGFQKNYENMPDEFKKKYTYDRFVSEAGSESWINDVREVVNKNNTPSEPKAQSDSE